MTAPVAHIAGKAGLRREAARAPIVVFAYRRAGGLRRTLESLERCPEYGDSDVYIFSDAPRTARSAGEVARVRRYLRSRGRPNERVIEAPEHKGLARSVIEGVSKVCDRYGRAVVMEDDLRVSPAALGWFNAALDRYADRPEVMQVSGYAYRVPEFRDRSDGVFLPFITSWGWATWKRAWDRFDPAAAGWDALLRDEALQARFDLDGAYRFSDLLARQMSAGLDSWGVRWYWSVFSAGGVALYPPRPLVRNAGADLKATHGMKSLLLADLLAGPRRLMADRPNLPDSVVTSADDLEAVRRAVRRRRF